jgi:hypothetical protein
VERVRVSFRALTDDEIAAYVATGEPMDKAGAYGIQGYGATIVERIEGDYFAVMGLSLVRLVALLGDVGVAYVYGRRRGGAIRARADASAARSCRSPRRAARRRGRRRPRRRPRRSRSSRPYEQGRSQ